MLANPALAGFLLALIPAVVLLAGATLVIALRRGRWKQVITIAVLLFKAWLALILLLLGLVVIKVVAVAAYLAFMHAAVATCEFFGLLPRGHLWVSSPSLITTRRGALLIGEPRSRFLLYLPHRTPRPSTQYISLA
jgi:hypothetical protein